MRRAIRLDERGLCQHGDVFQCPCAVSDYLKLQLLDRGHESFCVLFLDARHQLIEMKEMFRGTIDGATVYLREAVKEALRLNAAAMVLSTIIRATSPNSPRLTATSPANCSRRSRW